MRHLISCFRQFRHLHSAATRVSPCPRFPNHRTIWKQQTYCPVETRPQRRLVYSPATTPALRPHEIISVIETRIPFPGDDVAYVTVECNEERWEQFIEALRTLSLENWDEEYGNKDDWGMNFVHEQNHAGMADLESLRRKFQESFESRQVAWEGSANIFFLIDGDVIHSVLEGLSKGEVPFIYAVNGGYDSEEEDECYEGHFKMAANDLDWFWNIVSSGMRGMDQIRPCEKGSIRTCDYF
jgi:hypothetical protein